MAELESVEFSLPGIRDPQQFFELVQFYGEVLSGFDVVSTTYSGYIAREVLERVAWLFQNGQVMHMYMVARSRWQLPNDYVAAMLTAADIAFRAPPSTPVYTILLLTTVAEYDVNGATAVLVGGPGIGRGAIIDVQGTYGPQITVLFDGEVRSAWQLADMVRRAAQRYGGIRRALLHVAIPITSTYVSSFATPPHGIDVFLGNGWALAEWYPWLGARPQKLAAFGQPQPVPRSRASIFLKRYEGLCASATCVHAYTSRLMEPVDVAYVVRRGQNVPIRQVVGIATSLFVDSPSWQFYASLSMDYVGVGNTRVALAPSMVLDYMYVFMPFAAFEAHPIDVVKRACGAQGQANECLLDFLSTVVYRVAEIRQAKPHLAEESHKLFDRRYYNRLRGFLQLPTDVISYLMRIRDEFLTTLLGNAIIDISSGQSPLGHFTVYASGTVANRYIVTPISAVERIARALSLRCYGGEDRYLCVQPFYVDSWTDLNPNEVYVMYSVANRSIVTHRPPPPSRVDLRRLVIKRERIRDIVDGLSSHDFAVKVEQIGPDALRIVAYNVESTGTHYAVVTVPWIIRRAPGPEARHE